MSLVQAILISQPIQVATGRFSKECQICQGVVPVCHAIQVVTWTAQVEQSQNLAIEKAWSLNSFTGVLVPLQELENGLLGVWSPGSLRQKRILKQSQYIISFPFINQLADLLYRPNSYSDGTLVDFGWTGVRHSKFSQHSSQEETCIGPMSCRYLFKLHKKCTGLVSNCIHSVLGLVGQTRYTRILDCNSFF